MVLCSSYEVNAAESRRKAAGTLGSLIWVLSLLFIGDKNDSNCLFGR